MKWQSGSLAWSVLVGVGVLVACGHDGGLEEVVDEAGNLSLVAAPPLVTHRTDATFRLACAGQPCDLECRLDAGPRATCGREVRYQALADGKHVFEAYLGGSASGVRHSWEVDTAVPTVTLSGGPSGPTRATTAAFTLSCDEPGCRFACSLDGAAYGPCSSPRELAELGDGEHVFAARATDPAGNQGPSATHRWTVDSTGPLVAITSAPPARTRESSAAFAFECDAGDCVTECQLDRGPFESCRSPVSFAALATGEHAFAVRGRDALGNLGAASHHAWSIDVLAPDTRITAAPPGLTNQPSADFRFLSEEAEVFECSLDGAPYAACASGLSYTSLADGEHQFRVRAIDAAGNGDPTPASHVWVVDTVAPDTTLVAGPHSPTNQVTASFELGAGEPGSFVCTLDAASYPCSARFEVAALGPGEHTLEVSAVDGAGNVDGSPERHTWVVDLTAPRTTLVAAPLGPTRDTHAVFVFSADEAATFECSLDAGAFAPCSSGIRYTSLAAGPHDFRVRATDTAGNGAATPVSHTWEVDLAPPTTALVEGPAPLSNEASATFVFASDDAEATFACSLDAAELVSCASGVVFEPLGEGAHTLEVHAIDAAGNVDATPVRHAWTVDLSAPDTTITRGPPAFTQQLEASFAFTSADGAATFECSLDGAAFSTCSSELQSGALGAGPHVLRVRAVDLAGNRDATPASHGWTIDREPPDTVFIQRPPSPTFQTSATFRFVSNESVATFECSLDGAGYTSCTSGLTLTGLALGEHTLSVRARDAVDQRDPSPATHRWTIQAGEAARLASLSPERGTTGVPLVLAGSGFGASQGERFVTIAGERAVVHSWSDTYVVVLVPEGLAVGHWPVVMEPFAVASGSYEVVPWVRQLAPSVIDPGGVLYVRGASFGAQPGTARIGGRPAQVRSWRDGLVELEVGSDVAAGTHHVELLTAAGDTSNRVPLDVRGRDHWSAGEEAPAGRWSHVAAWTGSELLVWGGEAASDHPRQSGGRYDPVLQSWKPISREGAPAASSHVAAAWTGSELLVWGGSPARSGRYDPFTDRWRPISALGAPAERSAFTTVWTGRELLVWGGSDARNQSLQSGAIYDAATDSWRPMTTLGAPSARRSASGVWTGRELLVWGGRARQGSHYLAGGGRYDPTTDSWRPLGAAGEPSARVDHQAVWTGTEMLIWGGEGQAGLLNSGGRFDPSTDTWTELSTQGAPVGRTHHSAVWTGRELVVWGGRSSWSMVGDPHVDDGGRYDPATDRWTAISRDGSPAARGFHSATWTGSEMMVWGGESGLYAARSDGGRYDSRADAWQDMDGAATPAARAEHSAVWTGSEMIVWGGNNMSGSLATGGRYDPETRSWQATSADGAPAPRGRHSAVWTGTEMIVWGGSEQKVFATQLTLLDSGGRYDPHTDRWTPLSSSGAPSPREGHQALWTGRAMLVWGGQGADFSRPSEGGRYDPATDTWRPISAVGAPRGRTGFSAVWTGREMIVWGGLTADQRPSNDGARYDPVTDVWTPVSLTSRPSLREGHVAVWTGDEMIIWGGVDPQTGTHHRSGARYDPDTNRWRPISSAGAPAGRARARAVWTGREMILWGGDESSWGSNSGGRFDPDADAWTLTHAEGAPLARMHHGAVWTGRELLIWGGGPLMVATAVLSDGASYRP